jgi:membrane protease YdiL (CAAX protease family)
MSCPWGFPTALVSVVVAFAIYYGGALAILSRLGGSFDKRHHLIVLIAAYQALVAGVIVVAALIALLPRRAPPSALGYRFPGWVALGTAAASLIPILFVSTAIENLLNALFPSLHIHGNAAQLLPGHPHLSLIEELLLFVWAAVEAPLAEETLFRGILFQGLRDSLARVAPYQVGVFVAALVSGVMFGLVHGEPHTFPILTFLGITLAYIFQIARSVYASALVHGLVDGLAVLVLIHGP